MAKRKGKSGSGKLELHRVNLIYAREHGNRTCRVTQHVVLAESREEAMFLVAEDTYVYSDAHVVYSRVLEPGTVVHIGSHYISRKDAEDALAVQDPEHPHVHVKTLRESRCAICRKVPAVGGYDTPHGLACVKCWDEWAVKSINEEEKTDAVDNTVLR